MLIDFNAGSGVLLLFSLSFSSLLGLQKHVGHAGTAAPKVNLQISLKFHTKKASTDYSCNFYNPQTIAFVLQPHPLTSVHGNHLMIRSVCEEPRSTMSGIALATKVQFVAVKQLTGFKTRFC